MTRLLRGLLVLGLLIALGASLSGRLDELVPKDLPAAATQTITAATAAAPARVLDNGQWKIKSDTHPDQQQPGVGASTPPQTQPIPFPDNRNTSHNWSGYAATGGTYTSVSGTWTVPQFNADSQPGVDAAWVGIGGVRSRDLIQAGTQQSVTGSG